jgi:hypothetical protein
MHLRAGYADGAVLTTAELDLAMALAVVQDGSGNGQAMTSIRFGTKGFIFGATNQLWFAQNAYTVDGGSNWYPFDETAASYAWRVQSSNGITAQYSPALNADGAISWTQVAQINNLGISLSGALTVLNSDANASFTPIYPINRIRDKANITADRKLTLAAANDAQCVIVARNGSAGGHNRGVYQADGSTLIKNVADSFTGTFVYDINAALWFLEAYDACS